MVMPGETIKTGAHPYCKGCKVYLTVRVLRSNAGYYIGTQCGCGPYSRESGYYETEPEAQVALDRGEYDR